MLRTKETHTLPYREKTAWLSLIAIAIAFVPYFSIVAARILPARSMPNVGQLELYAAAAVVQMLILGAGHVCLRRGSPEEARIPPDERDREIINRSIRWAYYVLIAGMIVVGCVMPFTSGGWAIVNAAILWIIVAQAVHYSIVVVSYRRQT